MKNLEHILFSPDVMGGKPCIAGTRVTVGTLVGLVAGGKSIEEIVALYPYISQGDVTQALEYASMSVK